MIWKCHLVLLLGLIASCAQTEEGASFEHASAQGEESLPTFIKCHDAWAGLIDEWVDSTGGLERSIQSTRRKIAEDNETEFAAIVRASWLQQPEGEYPIEFGSWPVTDHEWDSVLKLEIQSPSLPRPCSFPFWTKGVFWHLIAEIGTPDKMRYEKPEDAPEDLSWNQSGAGTWIAYWLFTRMAEPILSTETVED